jgi:hypothetical protein
MSGLIRRLTERGREAFREWLEDGAAGAPPLALLDDPATSLPLHPSIPRPTRIHERRYDLGLDLVDSRQACPTERAPGPAAGWPTREFRRGETCVMMRVVEGEPDARIARRHERRYTP